MVATISCPAAPQARAVGMTEAATAARTMDLILAESRLKRRQGVSQVVNVAQVLLQDISRR